MTIAKEKISEIMSRTDIVEVISGYLPGLRKLGKNYKTLCPFHSEKTPSFTVSADKQMFFCFGCQTGGDAITFVMKIENISFAEAAKKLADKAGVLLEEKDFREVSESDAQKSRLKKVLTSAAAFYSKCLKSSDGAEALSYLKSRNIKDETLRNFQIGFAPDSKDALLRQLSSEKISLKDAMAAGLLTSRDNGSPADLFRNRIMFPIKGFNGDTIAFGGRAAGSASPKYLNSPETPLFSKRTTLYGLYQALPTLRKFKKVLIVEGYMDVITLHQYGINFAVSPLGTSLTRNQCLALRRYCEEAFLMFDPDSAGINASLKAADQLIEAGIYPKICLLEKGKDPDEFVIERGAEAFFEKMNEAVDPVTFKIKMIKKGGTEMGPKDKSRIAAFLRETVEKQKDQIIKSEWIKKISQELALPEKALLESSYKRSQEEENLSMEKIKINPLERGLIHLILKDPELTLKAGELKPEHFTSEFARSVFSEFLSQGPGLSIQELSGKYPQYAAQIMALSVEEPFDKGDLSQDFVQTASMIIDNFRLNKWREMKKRISSLNERELAEFNELCKIIKKEK